MTLINEQTAWVRMHSRATMPILVLDAVNADRLTYTATSDGVDAVFGSGGAGEQTTVLIEGTSGPSGLWSTLATIESVQSAPTVVIVQGVDRVRVRQSRIAGTPPTVPTNLRVSLSLTQDD